jgi:hypothetical protein
VLCSLFRLFWNQKVALDFFWITCRRGTWHNEVKLGRKHIARTGNTAREIWKLMENGKGKEEHVA